MIVKMAHSAVTHSLLATSSDYQYGVFHRYSRQVAVVVGSQCSGGLGTEAN